MNRLLSVGLISLSLATTRFLSSMENEPPQKRRRILTASTESVSSQLLTQPLAQSSNCFDRSCAFHVFRMFLTSGLKLAEFLFFENLELIYRPQTQHMIVPPKQENDFECSNFGNPSLPRLQKDILQKIFCEHLAGTLAAPSGEIMTKNFHAPKIDMGHTIRFFVCSTPEDYTKILNLVDISLDTAVNNNIKSTMKDQARTIINLCLSNGESTLNPFAEQNKDNQLAKKSLSTAKFYLNKNQRTIVPEHIGQLSQLVCDNTHQNNFLEQKYGNNLDNQSLLSFKLNGVFL